MPKNVKEEKNKTDGFIEKELLDAVKKNDIKKVQNLLNIENIMKAFDRDPSQELHILRNQLNKYVGKTINLEYKDEKGYTALLRACENENINMVRLLIEKGVKIDKDENYWDSDNNRDQVKSPLHLAVENNDDILTQLLIKKGHPIEPMYDYSIWESPLAYAVLKENFKIVKILIDNGADVNYTISGEIDVPLSKFNNYQYFTLLTFAIEKNILDDIAILLIEKSNKSHIHERSGPEKYSTTALLTAIENDKPNIVKLLLLTEPDIEEEIDYYSDKTAFDIANEKGNKKIIKMLEEYVK